MAKMTFTEWLYEKYGMEGDPTDMYEVDQDAYEELEDEYYKDMETNK